MDREHSTDNDGPTPSQPLRLNDPLSGIGGPMTRSRTKKMQDALNTLIEEVLMEGSTIKASEMSKAIHLLSII